MPGIPGAIATTTLGENFLPERVVVKHGKDTTEFVYGDFQDFNNPLHRIEALYAGTIVERRNGAVVRDLKTTLTEIGQVYVVLPVPSSVRQGRPGATGGRHAASGERLCAAVPGCARDGGHCDATADRAGSRT